MDELTLDGEIYVSSKRAAKITGYAKDYIGQLCREGRVKARQVGRNWYVLESSIREHRFGADIKENPESSAVNQTPSILGKVKYSSESTPTLPEIGSTVRENEPMSFLSKENQEIEHKIEVFPQFNSDLSASKSTTYSLDSGIEAFSNLTESNSSKDFTDSTVKEMHSVWKDWFDRKENGLSTAAIEETLLEDPKIMDARESLNDSNEDIQPLNSDSKEEHIPLHIMRPSESLQERFEKESHSNHIDRDQPASKEKFGAFMDRSEPVSPKKSYYAHTPTRAAASFDLAKQYVEPSWESKLNEIGSYSTEGNLIRSQKKLKISRKPSALWNAIFITLSVLIIAITLIGTGYANAFLPQQALQYLPIQYFQGITLVNKFNK